MKKKDEDTEVKRTKLDISDPTVMFNMMMPMIMMIMMMAMMVPMLKGIDKK